MMWDTAAGTLQSATTPNIPSIVPRLRPLSDGWTFALPGAEAATSGRPAYAWDQFTMAPGECRASHSRSVGSFFRPPHEPRRRSSDRASRRSSRPHSPNKNDLKRIHWYPAIPPASEELARLAGARTAWKAAIEHAGFLGVADRPVVKRFADQPGAVAFPCPSRRRCGRLFSNLVPFGLRQDDGFLAAWIAGFIAPEWRRTSAIGGPRAMRDFVSSPNRAR